MKREIFLVTIVLLSVLVPGCTGSGRSDVSQQAALQNTTVPNGSADPYIAEYEQGLLHHSAAKDSFDNATSLWDAGNYSAAVADYRDAMREYGLASQHYGNMARYAGNASDRDFASAVSQCTDLMGEASENFADAANVSDASDTSAAYADFLKGQDLMDQSDALLNRSLLLMPPWLDGAA